MHNQARRIVMAGDASPVDLAGALFVLESDSLPGADASAVASWSPDFGTGAFVQAAGANQPVLQTSEFNVAPAVEFTDGSDYLVWEGSAAPAELTLAFVVRIHAFDGASYNTRALFTSAAAADAFPSGVGGVSVLVNHDFGGGVQLYCASATNDADILTGVTTDPTLVVITISATAAAIRLNGVEAATDVCGNAGFTLARTSLGGYYLADGTYAAHGNFDLAFAAAYSRVLSAGELAALEAYLTAKYL